MLDLELKQVSERWKLYKNTKLKINPGITILFGKNGSGKTYCLNQIRNKYKDALSLDMVKETANDLIYMDNKDIVKWINASEGQRIYDNLGYYSKIIGQYVKDCFENKKEPIILVDGCDSGVSPDLIKVMKDFFNLIDNDIKKSNLIGYIIISSNNYELIKDLDCIFIETLEKCKFNSKNPEDYNRWIKYYFDK